jgi:hypothetical protein
MNPRRDRHVRSRFVRRARERDARRVPGSSPPKNEIHAALLGEALKAGPDVNAAQAALGLDQRAARDDCAESPDRLPPVRIGAAVQFLATDQRTARLEASNRQRPKL